MWLAYVLHPLVNGGHGFGAVLRMLMKRNRSW